MRQATVKQSSRNRHAIAGANVITYTYTYVCLFVVVFIFQHEAVDDMSVDSGIHIFYNTDKYRVANVGKKEEGGG